MDQGPRTVRDRFLSLYQSCAADVARRKATAAGPESTAALESLDLPVKPREVAAAEAIAEQVYLEGLEGKDEKTVEVPPEEPVNLEEMSVGENIKVCASLSLNLMWAYFKNDVDKINQIEKNFLPGSKCDAKWVETIREYVKYYGLDGTEHSIPYIKPAAVGPKVIPVKAGSRIGLIGDWGTGAEPAKRVLRQLKAQNPDILIHLGDIYYSGTPTECQINFEAVVNSVFDRANTHLPIYTLSGNHDMYSGGLGYYDLIKRLNQPPMTQPASFFCLRAEDDSWQLLAMDTGQHDHKPDPRNPVPTHVEQDELNWHEQRIREFPGKTILLSHHQLFSAFSPVAPAAENGREPSFNPQLKAAFDQLRGTGKDVAAWFWGHEHNLCIYESHLGLARGRCLGHSAIPVFSQDEPYKVRSEIDSPPTIAQGSQDQTSELSIQDNVYTHGFAMLTLGATRVSVDYFEDLNGVARKHYSEQIE